MTKKFDNGSYAFPCPEDERNYRADGMTLRAYFAAHAPYTLADVENIWSGTQGDEKPSGRDLLEMMVALRFAYADNMIREMDEESVK